MKYLLVKSGMYYRPNKSGYTGLKRCAGLYYKKDEIPEEGITAIHYDDAPATSKNCCHFERNEELERRILLNQILLYSYTTKNIVELRKYIENIKETP